MITSSMAVVDAGLTVFNLLDTPHSETAARVWKEFLQQKTTLYAPGLWRYEVTSVIHAYAFEGVIETQEGEAAIETAFELSINLVDEDRDLCQAAFRWASLLNQRSAYDGFYLALADRLGAQFWTSDRRLVNNASGLGADWIHWMGELN